VTSPACSSPSGPPDSPHQATGLCSRHPLAFTRRSRTPSTRTDQGAQQPPPTNNPAAYPQVTSTASPPPTPDVVPAQPGPSRSAAGRVRPQPAPANTVQQPGQYGSSKPRPQYGFQQPGQYGVPLWPVQPGQGVLAVGSSTPTERRKFQEVGWPHPRVVCGPPRPPSSIAVVRAVPFRPLGWGGGSPAFFVNHKLHVAPAPRRGVWLADRSERRSQLLRREATQGRQCNKPTTFHPRGE